MEEAIEKLLTFLEPYLPLANAHNTDFFTHQHWNTLVAPTVAAQLLELDTSELAKLPNGDLFKCRGSNVAEREDLTTTQRCYGGSAKDNSETFQENLEMKKANKSEPLVKTSVSASHTRCTSDKSTDGEDDQTQIRKVTKFPRQKWDHSQRPRWTHTDLESFVLDARKHTLPNLEVESPIESVLKYFRTGLSELVEIDSHMSAKKSHEVHIMSQTCAAICKSRGISNVIDIGSGKGYLATELAFQHQLKVLGIDSSSVNTASAENRQKKLGKYWTGLYKKATGREVLKSNSDHVSKESIRVNPAAESNMVSKDDDMISNILESTPTSSSLTISKNLCNVTLYVTKDLDLMQVHRDAFLIQEDATEAETNKFAITGLHTCGNLGSSMLQIFAGSPHAEFLFNIGCCYHLIEEEFVENPFQANDVSDVDLEFGFPLSQYLRKKGCKLGRNARMLACQAADRMVENHQMPDDSLFYRAVLQVILRHLTGETRNDWQIGKIAKKCKGFVDYTKKALNKLNISNALQDGEIEDFYTKCLNEKEQLDAYFQLRAVLAPCIEGLILLDRLLFLQEQKDINQCFLVKLFDSVASPRCYCIISEKQGYPS